MRFLVKTPETLTEEEAITLFLQGTANRDIAVDIETVSIENRLPLGIAVALSSEIGYYFYNTKDPLLACLNNNKLIFHNAKFDLAILESLGYTVNEYEDTMFMAYTNGMLENSLDALAPLVGKTFTSVTTLWETAKGKKSSHNIGVDHVKLGELSIGHACITYALAYELPMNTLYQEIDKPMIPLLMEMEKWGLLIDQYVLTGIEQECVTKAAALSQEIKSELGDINLGSSTQVAKVLKGLGIIGTKKTKGGKEAVSDESLAPLNNPLTNKLLAWRKEMKTISTYVSAFRNPDSLGRIQTNFGLASTGRYTSSKPNQQNLTNGNLRNAIVTPPGYTFISLDASQLELRVVAIISQDKVMMDMVATEDSHLSTAMVVFNDPERRYDAKQLNFAVLYGADDYKLAEMTGKTLKEAASLRNAYFVKLQRLNRWIRETKKQAAIDGYVTNLFGRRRPIPEIQSEFPSVKAKGEREAINTIVQGTAADIVKMMMLYLKNLVHPEVRFVLQVHDEILLEVPDGLIQETQKIIATLIKAFPDYPLTMKVGKSYGGLEKE